MSVYSVWESHFPPDAAEEGRAVTEAIWRDMPGFEGYISHEVVADLDDPGHLLVISQWASRRDADASLREYATHPNARRANGLSSRPRSRFVGHAVTAAR
jgi:quinol monooxygenase YgiN